MSLLAETSCLVLGAGGFIGSALCRALHEAGAETHGTLRPGGGRWRRGGVPRSATVHEVDLLDAEAVEDLLRTARPRLIFNTVCHSSRAYADPLARILADDVLTLAHLLDAIRAVHPRLEERPRLVQLGSSLELGPSVAPHRPDDPLRPTTLRGASRGAASLLALQQARSGLIPAVVIRPFHVYGPWESPDRLVPTAIRAALRGEILPLTAGGFLRDLVYVDDVAAGCLAAAVNEEAAGEIFHLGSGRGISNDELVRAVEHAAGKTIRVARGAFPARPQDSPARVADITWARAMLGWTPRTSLDAGLRATVDWVREQPATSEAAR